jgi:two-component system, OmpR family, response regulator
MNTPAIRRILAIEDRVLPAQSIAATLCASGFDVDLAGTGREGIAKAMTHNYGLLALERRLPDLDGLRIVATLRQAGFRRPVVLVDSAANAEERAQGLRSGCDDYLIRPFDADEMTARIEALLRRCPPDVTPQTVLRTGELTLDLVRRELTCRNQPLRLRPTELRLLEFMMRHAGQTLPRSVIFEAVWHGRFNPGTNLVDVHVGRLRNKLDIPGKPSLIRTVRGAGYLLG